MARTFTMRVLLITASLVTVLTLSLSGLPAYAAPPVERLLPAETLAMISTPGFSHLRSAWDQMPQGALWNDEAFKPFREEFLKNLKKELLTPLQRELGLDLVAWGGTLEGPLTFALVQNPGAERPLDFLFLADSQNNSEKLSTNLTSLRTSCLKTGNDLRSVKIRNVDFMAVSLASNDLPKTLAPFFPRLLELHELGAQENTRKSSPTELYIGQADSLLIVAGSANTAERILIRVQNGTTPVLAELGAYESSRLSLFRNASLYGWINAKLLMANMAQEPSSEVPSPMDVVRPETFLRASGFAELTSVSFGLHASTEGVASKLVFAVPEANRRGLFRVFSAQPRDVGVPAFVPADVVRLRRWRIDGQKAWAGLEAVFAEMSPQWTSAIQFILKTANDAARLKDPAFDLDRNLFGNLGDDFMYLEKVPRGSAPQQVASPPSLWLMSSPDPQQLAASLKSVLIFMTSQAESPAEREFLGRKIYSVPLPYLPNPLGDNSALVQPKILFYAATGGYVALSTDAALLEEYLRSPESRAQPLRQLAGLPEAAQIVLHPSSILFGFHNQRETGRLEYEALRAGAAGNTNSSLSSSLLTGVFGLASPEKKLQELMEFSLLPPFDRIASHFRFSVHSGNVTTDSVTLEFFTPSPRSTNLRAAQTP